MRLPYGLWFRNGSGFLLPLSSPRSANYGYILYSAHTDPWNATYGRDRSIDRALRQWWNSVAPVFGYRRNDSPRNFPSNRSPRVPLGARASRVRVTTAISPYKKRRNERARGRWDLCGYYAIGCRRYTDCLVALRRGSEQTNRCSALSFIGLSPMLIDSRNRFTSFSTPRPVCFDFGGVRIDLRGIVGLRARKRRSL